MKQLINAYHKDIHVSGTVVYFRGDWSTEDVEIHSGDITKEEAIEMIFDQFDKEAELMMDGPSFSQSCFDDEFFMDDSDEDSIF